jgi:hypothetical protein
MSHLLVIQATAPLRADELARIERAVEKALRVEDSMSAMPIRAPFHVIVSQCVDAHTHYHEGRI